MEKFSAHFPRYGKIISTPWKKQPRARPLPQKFSTLWKTFFHTVEKFQPPRPIPAKVFHTMENFFPHCGIAECRAQAAGAERTRGL
jgi:hypothetical protein